MYSFLAKNRIVIFLIALLIFLLAFLARIVLNQLTDITPTSSERTLHAYQLPLESIRTVYLRALYVVPPEEDPYPDWQEKIENSLTTITRFHNMQFLGESTLNITVHPEPLSLNTELDLVGSIDEESTADAQALSDALSDLARSENILPSASSPDDYPITLIIYEGMTYGGDKNIAVVSRELLTDENFESTRGSYIYHVLGHALNMPDLEAVGEKPPTFSVMGVGQRYPFDMTFIDVGSLCHMGMRDMCKLF